MHKGAIYDIFLIFWRIRHGYAGIRGEYANRYSGIFRHIRAYSGIREFAGIYQRLSKFTRIRANTRIGYSPIRGHTRTFAQVHRDVSAYGLGHISPHIAQDAQAQAGTHTTFPTPGYPDFSRSGKSAAEFAQEPSQFARMAPASRAVDASRPSGSADAQDLAHGRSSSGRGLPRGRRAPP